MNNRNFTYIHIFLGLSLLLINLSVCIYICWNGTENSLLEDHEKISTWMHKYDWKRHTQIKGFLYFQFLETGNNRKPCMCVCVSDFVCMSISVYMRVCICIHVYYICMCMSVIVCYVCGELVCISKKKKLCKMSSLSRDIQRDRKTVRRTLQ